MSSYVGLAMQGAMGAAQTYGAFYEGRQQRDYLRMQSQLNLEQKKVAIAKIETEERLSEQQKAEAIYQRAADNQKIETYKDQSGKLVSKGIVKAAKSGADIAHGSPLDYLSYMTDERAKTTAQMSWARDVSYWKGNVKSAMTLDAANLERAGLPLYDYQSQLYTTAADEAMKAATIKGMTSSLKTGTAMIWGS